MEARPSTATEVMNRILDLENEKQRSIDAIKAKLDEIRTAEQAAADAADEAINNTDLEAYSAAKAEKEKIRTEAEMYKERLERLQRKKFVSREESDTVIDSLLQYEKDLAADYEEAIKKPVEQLRKLNSDYLNEVEHTEDVIKAWTTRIHANYKNELVTYSDKDPRKGQPCPVHPARYVGSAAAVVVKNFLERIE